MNERVDVGRDVEVDIAVVGAGPGGMAAAVAARSAGRSVVVLDEQPRPGGQIYRGIENATPALRGVLGTDYAAGAAPVDGLRASGAHYVPGAAVWQITRERELHYLQDGAARRLRAGRVILCMGAIERPMPMPGWTLPGVMTAGAAQILLKSSAVAPAGPVALAGCGPLLYLLAWQLRRAGMPVRAVIDTTDWRAYARALPLLPGALREWRLLAKGMRLLAALRGNGTAVYGGAQALAVEGDEAARAIRFIAGGRAHRVDASLILLHQGVVPNTHASMALRAAHRWDEAQLCWVPVTHETGELAGLPGVFVAGDGAGIIGAQACAVSGRIAGLAAAGNHAAPAEIAALLASLRRTRAARRYLDRLFRPLPSLRVPADDVIVCRCEEVTAGELRRLVRAGCEGPNQMKAFTRCGMGPCQGRQCAVTVSELIAAERGVPVEQVGHLRIRPPLKPITLGELAT